MLLYDVAAASSDSVAVLSAGAQGGLVIGSRTIDDRAWGNSALVSRVSSTANTLPKWSGTSAGSYSLANSNLSDTGSVITAASRFSVTAAASSGATAVINCTTADVTGGEQTLQIYASNSSTNPVFGVFRSPGILLQNTSAVDGTYTGMTFLDSNGASIASILGVAKTQSTDTGNIVFLTRATTAGGSVEVARLDENGRLSLPVNSTLAGIELGSDIPIYRNGANLAHIDSDLRVYPTTTGTNNYGLSVIKTFSPDRAGEKAAITVNPTYTVAASSAADLQQGLRVNGAWSFTTASATTAFGAVSYLQFTGSGGSSSVTSYYSAGVVNAGFTVPLLRHYSAVGFTNSGTITDHRGFDVGDLSGTNVYGVRIGVTSGTNRYSIYTDSAQSYFGGTASATQLISRVTTGTAPLVVSSGTMVTNLNANFLGGHTWNSALAVSGGAVFGGAVWDSVDARWEHTVASGYAFTFRHSDAEGVSAGQGGALFLMFGDTPSAGVGSSIGGIQYIRFDKNGKVTAGQFVSQVTTGTAPLTIASTTVVSNLNADLLDGQHGSYYAAASSLSSYLPLSGGTVSGDIYFTGGHKYWHANNDGASSGLDSDLLDGQHGSYYTNELNSTLPSPLILNNNLVPNVQATVNHLLGTVGDAFAFRAVTDVEYWNGSAWTSTSAINPQQLLTGKVGYAIMTVAPTYRKFRFVVTSSSYLGPVMLAVHQTWNNGAHQVAVTLERGPTASGAWTTMIPETLSNADENNYNFYVASSVGQNADVYYRVTLDSQDATNSTSYVGLRLLFSYTRSTDLPGGEVMPMTWNSSRQTTFPANVTVASGSPAFVFRQTGSSVNHRWLDVNANTFRILKTNDAYDTWTTQLTIDSTGNCGIGAVTPTYGLHVRAPGTNLAIFEATRADGPVYVLLTNLNAPTHTWGMGATETGQFLLTKAGVGSWISVDTSLTATFTNTPYVGGAVVWHSGNDGSSSTLDADLLDGNHASAFASVSHTHTGVYEPVFSKGDIIQGTGVTLSGTLTGRLVGSGNITINATGTGVTDHGALTGLADDDHSQYHNDARGDARYLRLTGGTVTGATTFSNAVHSIRAAPAGEIAAYILVTLEDPETLAKQVMNRPLASLKSDLGTMPPSSHTHGNITNGGFLGTTAAIPLITGTAGIIQAGSFGSASGTFCQGNDSRLSDSRNPLSHSHGNIGNGGAIGVTANLPIITTTGGVLITGSFGTGANTFCQGNDSRLSDSRNPLSHSHGNIGNGGAIGVTANLPIITSTSGVLTTGSFGTGANTFCQGNDSRLSDARTPTAHKSSHEVGGGDPLTGSLDANARVGVRVNTGGSTYTRRRINFIAGSGISISVSDDSGSEEIDVTISAV